jgi:hypothetical protein
MVPSLFLVISFLADHPYIVIAAVSGLGLVMLWVFCYCLLTAFDSMYAAHKADRVRTLVEEWRRTDDYKEIWSEDAGAHRSMKWRIDE